jgi:8-oxo-dGTP pyrophosphatase MutT (NUDIX family)
MRVFYAKEAFPDEVTLALYLMGPTPRAQLGVQPSWRAEALACLEELDFNGEVFVPEPRDGNWLGDYQEQAAWEEAGLHRADRILVWLPRAMPTLPGLTTNDEWGYWKGRDPARLLFGAPPGAEYVRYQEHYARELGIPIYRTLAALCRAALADPGERRCGGECQVPLHIWRTDAFKAWYASQQQAGNELRAAKIEWVFRVDQGLVHYWALHVDVFVVAESRSKSNEVILARPDVAAVVLFHAGPDLLDTEVVLVQEFRSPGRTADGYIWEIPGGSSPKPGQSALATAVAEVEEEVGLAVAPLAVRLHQARQAVGTLSVHQVQVFSVALTAEQMAELRTREAAGLAYGNDAASERTFVRIRTVRQMLADASTDWTTMGMILTVLHQRLALNAGI